MHSLQNRLWTVGGALAIALALAAPALAQGTYTLNPPKIGSGSVADADPPELRPSTKECRADLFTNFESGGSSRTFTYTPPANCPGPWAKVVFNADFHTTGTNQFDRTAEFLLGNVMIYYGTTQEPSPTEQPYWHVESDVTDYSALFKTTQPGTFELGNYVEGPYCCSQYASAYLQFYKQSPTYPGQRVADQVLPMTDTPGAPILTNSTSTISQTFNLPSNVEEAYLDVYTQGQNQDEFWWSCIPNDALPILGAQYNCGNTAFRQAAIQVDGKAAGYAPIIPYVFTGGVDPDLWRPIPGVQTLDFKPYRINLTPFAGELSNGKPHTITVSVDNASNYFLADATLLLFQDAQSTQVTGALTRNTIGPIPAPTEHEELSNYAKNGSGSIVVTDAQPYTLEGYVNTSHGTVTTEVESQLSFINTQVYTSLSEVLTQETKASRRTNTRNGTHYESQLDSIDFPFQYTFYEEMYPNTNISETLSIGQKLTEEKSDTVDGILVSSTKLIDELHPVDKLIFTASGNFVSEPIDTSTEHYTFTDLAGHCWDRSVSASNALVSAVSDGASCPGGVNHW